MEYARKYLKQHVEQNAINEVRKVREIDVYTSLIVKSFDEEINKLSERMINLYQERNLYEEHKTNVQKEIFSIIKKMQSLPSKDSHETNSEVITELHNRLGYLRREMLSAQDNYDNICRNIDELKCEEESIKKFKDHFGNRYDNLIKGFINDFDS